MTNEEQILQMLANMQKSIDKLDNKIENEVVKLTTKIENEVVKLTTKIENEASKININIENEVTKRLDSLFDGYMLTHEKQYDLERQIVALQRRVEAIEIKVSQ